MIKKIFICCIGVATFAIGSAVSSVANFGVDPWTSLNSGVSNLTDISIGTSSIILQSIIAVIVFFLARKYINIGTLINIIGFGVVFDAVSALLRHSALFQMASSVERLLLMLAGILLFSLGLAICAGCDLGLAPYDAVSWLLNQYLKFPYSTARIATDGFCVIVAWLTGGSIGIGTLITVSCVGPMVQFWSKMLQKYSHQIA